MVRPCKDIKSHLRSCGVAQVSCSVDDLDGVAREAAAGQRESQQHFEQHLFPPLRALTEAPPPDGADETFYELVVEDGTISDLSEDPSP